MECHSINNQAHTTLVKHIQMEVENNRAIKLWMDIWQVFLSIADTSGLEPHKSESVYKHQARVMS